MEIKTIVKFNNEVKVAFAAAIAEKVFMQIDKTDDRYLEGRKSLNKCWKWAEDNSVSGDDLYELIDNPQCTGISEFAEDEEDINIAWIWSLLVDIVSYTSWLAYKKENMKYLPQALEGIREDSIILLIESAIKTGFISKDEILIMEENLLANYKIESNSALIKRDSFLNKIIK